MRPKAGAFSRYRPRVLTLIVLIVVAVPIVVANVCHDEVSPQVWPPPQPSYGWPFIWYWCEFPTVKAGGVPNQLNPELVRWSGPRLAGNLAIWFVMLTVSGVACEWLLRRCFPRLSFRPRLVTHIVLILVAAPIVLANLSHDEWTPGGMGNLRQYPTYGWPLIWRWRNCVVGYGSLTELDQNYSAALLTGNLAMWLAMLAAAGGTCEWLLRRFRPRLRWSLRTMLAVVVVLAMFCAWCTALRDRANLQDPVISAYDVRKGGVYHLYLERWGPKWLDVVGADRFRRSVVGADVNYSDDDDEEFLKRLGRLPDVRHLVIGVSGMTPGLAASLGDMPQLRMLRIACRYSDEDAAHECLAWVGKLSQLERLCLVGLRNVRSNDLAYLAGLTSLKSLELKIFCDEEEAHDWLVAVGELTQLERLCLTGLEFRGHDLACVYHLTKLKSLTLERQYYDGEAVHECLEAVGKLTQLERLCLEEWWPVRSHDLAQLAGLTNLRALGLRDYWPDSTANDGAIEGLPKTGTLIPLTHLPALPQLETMDVEGSAVGDRDLGQLAVLPRLKSLNLSGTLVTSAGLAELGRLECLEELAIDNGIASAAGLESLLALKRLKALHIGSNNLSNENYYPTPLPLDNGGRIFVRESELDRCRRAIQALLHSKPGIVIDSDTDVFNERRAPKPSWEDEERLYRAFYGW